MGSRWYCRWGFETYDGKAYACTVCVCGDHGDEQKNHFFRRSDSSLQWQQWAVRVEAVLSAIQWGKDKPGIKV